ncbi:MAG TPA: glutaredoxin domain-containing protein, partial [Candidatus Nanopelagicales bacterium]|nr:glutaredoxin domain-containing protein [Candidatus Nanopelagicales bacterium]
PLVRVILSDREEGTRDMFYVADLTQKGADGGYAVKTMPRRDWEGLLEQRRGAHLAKLAPPPPAAPSPPSPPSPGSPGDAPSPAPTQAPAQPTPGLAGVTAIIYGASWCKPCHEAAAYLKSKGVSVVEKDIEENPAAAAEMQDKLARANRRGGSIPIIDVRGQILMGFSPGQLDRAIAKAASGTVL